MIPLTFEQIEKIRIFLQKNYKDPVYIGVDIEPRRIYLKGQ